MISKRSIALLIVFLVGSFACTDTPQTTQNTEVNNATGTNAAEENANANPNANQSEEELDDNYYLEAIGSTSLYGTAGDTVTLGVRLTHGETGPVENQPIHYDVVDATGDPGVGFNAATVMSSESGQATNEVRVGHLSGEITVHVWHAQVEAPVEFTVEVTAIADGDLRISVDFSDDDALLQPIDDVEIRFWETSRIDCPLTAPFSQPVDPAIDEALLPTVEDEVLYEDLDTAKTYTVTAHGHGPQDQISAFGCIDDIPLQGDEITDAVVPLYLIPLTPQGTYDVVSHWDFTEALESTGVVGETIVAAFDFIDDPGQAAAGYVTDLAVDWVCDEYGSGSVECGAAQVAQGEAEDIIADFINDQVASIGIIDDFLTLAEDLRDTVENMKVDSLLTITNRSVGEGELQGLDIWQVVYFYWTQNCGPNDPPDCGEIAIDLGSGTNFGILRGDWEGRLYDYDQLEIDPHEMLVPYGKFINHILGEYLLPSFTNGQATSLSEAFEVLLCDNLDDIDIWGFTIDASTMQNLCNTAFSTVGDLVEFYIDTLEYDINLAISGHGHMIDLESDGRVDVIEDGEFFGELIDDQGEAVEMDADFSAVRQ